MSQNQEIIESKLCAYIDGELDDAGRVDIEKHLEANPQHRRLLEELRRTSALLRAPPRDPAPSELSETFTAQLERSVLLHGIGDGSSDGSMRMGRTPQFFAAAAIILLTVGLAVVIYFALPTHGVHPVVASSAMHPGTQPSELGLPNDLETAAKSGSRGFDKKEMAAASPGRPSQDTASNRKSTADGRAGDASVGIDESTRLRQMARRAAGNPNDLLRPAPSDRTPANSAADMALVMLVQSDDLGRTHQKLEDYFTANGIKWEPADDTAPARAEKPSVSNDGAVATQERSEARGKGANLKSEGEGLAPEAAPPAAGSATTGPSTRPQSPPLPDEAFLRTQSQSSTAPAKGLAESDAAVGPDEAGSRKRDDAATSAPVSRVVFAARMTRRQAVALGDTLQREGAAQEARVEETTNLDKNTLAEVTGAARRELAPEGALGGPSTRPALATALAATAPGAAIPTTEPDNADASGISTTQPANAARGVGARDLNNQLEKQNPPAPVVADAVKESQKSAAPAPAGAALAPRSGQIIVNSKNALSLTTQPAAGEKKDDAEQSGSNADEPVNVVILVRSDGLTPEPTPDAPPAAPDATTEPASVVPSPAPAATQPTAQ